MHGKSKTVSCQNKIRHFTSRTLPFVVTVYLVCLFFSPLSCLLVPSYSFHTGNLSTAFIISQQGNECHIRQLLGLRSKVIPQNLAHLPCVLCLPWDTGSACTLQCECHYCHTDPLGQYIHIHACILNDIHFCIWTFHFAFAFVIMVTNTKA